MGRRAAHPTNYYYFKPIYYTTNDINLNFLPIRPIRAMRSFYAPIDCSHVIVFGGEKVVLAGKPTYLVPPGVHFGVQSLGSLTPLPPIHLSLLNAQYA